VYAVGTGAPPRTLGSWRPSRAVTPAGQRANTSDATS
jgi:hypothetical protein